MRHKIKLRNSELALAVSRLSMTLNKDTFQGYRPRMLFCTGCTGSREQDGTWTVDFEYEEVGNRPAWAYSNGDWDLVESLIIQDD